MVIAIYTIILLISVYYYKNKCLNLESTRSNVFLCLIVFLCWFANVVDYLCIVEDRSLSYPVFILVTFVYLQLMPSVFLFISDRFHLNKLSATTIGLYSLTLLSFVPVGVIYLDTVPYKGAIDDVGVFIISKGEIVATFDIFSLVMVVQSIWIFVRLLILYSELKKRNYKIVNQAKTLFVIFCCVGIVSIIEAVIPNNLFSQAVVYISALLTNLVLLLWALRTLSPGIAPSFAVDSKIEPVYVEEKPENRTIKEKFDSIMTRESLFCDPGLTIEQIAARMKTNSAYIINMLKEEYNMSFASYVNMKRIEKAKDLILEGNYGKLEDVGRAVGFTNAPTFTKTFRIFTGVTPKEWRSKSR